MKNNTSLTMTGINTITELMKNNTSLTMKGINTITDGAYLPEHYHFVFEGILLGLYMASLLQQRFQMLSKIVKIVKSLRHTNDDPPDIQNYLRTMQTLLGEDENDLGNQIQNVATDTPKLCTSISRIDTSECLQKYLIDQRLV